MLNILTNAGYQKHSMYFPITLNSPFTFRGVLFEFDNHIGTINVVV